MNDKIIEKWPEILDFFKKEYEVSDVAFKTFLSFLSPVSVKDNILTVAYDDTTKGPEYGAHSLDFIQKKYGVFIKAAVAECLNEDYEIEYILKSKTVVPKDKQSSMKNNDSYLNLNPKYTFDTFVVGPFNEFAHSAAVGVSENLGEYYNPLFIYGGVGLGKTHLMHAIAHHALELNPNLNILYVTSEKFTNDLIQSIRNKTTSDFREKYRNIDVLLIDDIQFISGKDSTQEEFFHTFNALYESKKQIIISSDRPPKDISILEDRLRSRFEWGLIADIKSPNYETRMAILNKKVESDCLTIDTSILNFIAENIKSNVRELEGSLTKLIALSRLKKKEINMELAREAIQDYINVDSHKTVTLEYVVDIVADHYGLTPQEIYSKNRSNKIAAPRMIVMYLCHKYLSLSYTDIGKKLGGKDHATIMHGCSKVEEDLKDDIPLQNTIEILLKKINPQ